MFNQDQVAAASIAQIFGSELLRVQNSARTDSGHSPDILKLDPKQFLYGSAQQNTNQKLHERQMAEALQREAEAMCPLPQESYTPQVSVATLPPELASTPAQPRVIPGLPRARVPLDDFASVDVWERIAISLERIAGAVDKVDIKAKKKTVKRKIKNTKQILLNETHA